MGFVVGDFDERGADGFAVGVGPVLFLVGFAFGEIGFGFGIGWFFVRKMVAGQIGDEVFKAFRLRTCFANGAVDGGAVGDPLHDFHDFLAVEGFAFAFWRHGSFGTGIAEDGDEEIAGVEVAGDDHVIFGEAALKMIDVVEADAAFALAFLVAMTVGALVHEDGQDVAFVVEGMCHRSDGGEQPGDRKGRGKTGKSRPKLRPHVVDYPDFAEFVQFSGIFAFY